MNTLTDQDTETRENMLRRELAKNGFLLKKSHVFIPNSYNLGGYKIVYASRNQVVAGSKFELSLDNLEDFMASE
jgi:hypothetical protein